MGIWYATREQVTRSLEIFSSVKTNSVVDACIDSGSRAVEALLRRRFYPEQKTVKFDWPNYQYSAPWTMYLNSNELISVTSVVSGGVTIPPANYFLRRGDDIDEPPYSIIEINLASASAFAAGTTFQRSLSITGLYGDKDTEVSIPHGLLGAGINAAVTSLIINPSGGIYPVGVGSVVLIGTERLVMTNRRMSDTGQNLQTNMLDSQSDVIVDVTDGTAFAVDETILLGAERMRIVDIAGNNLIVDRAFDGSLLTTHTAPEDVFALRTFTAQRGALGSTAAAHSLNDPVYAHTFPVLTPLVNQLAVAEAVTMIEQNSAGYARVVGAGSNARESGGQGLIDLRALAVQAHGRVSRSAAI